MTQRLRRSEMLFEGLLTGFRTLFQKERASNRGQAEVSYRCHWDGEKSKTTKFL